MSLFCLSAKPTVQFEFETTIDKPAPQVFIITYAIFVDTSTELYLPVLQFSIFSFSVDLWEPEPNPFAPV